MWDCCQTRVNSTDFIFRSTRGSPDADQHAPIYIMASNNYNVSLTSINHFNCVLHTYTSYFAQSITTVSLCHTIMTGGGTTPLMDTTLL